MSTSPDRRLIVPSQFLAAYRIEDMLREQLEGWRDYTTSSFAVRMFPGNHFFLHNSAPVLLRMIAQDLRKPGGNGPAL